VSHRNFAVPNICGNSSLKRLRFYSLWASPLLFVVGILGFADEISHQRQATISAVLDGDTVILARNKAHARLVGINCPEIDHKRKSAEPLGFKARDYLKGLVGGKRVTLVSGIQPRDHYQRELVSLFLADGSNVQLQLIANGLCSVIAVPPNLRFLANYLLAEQTARIARKGLWGNSYFEPRNAMRLGPDDQGYRFVKGRVQRIGKSKKYVYLNLNNNFFISIRHENWVKYWGDNPENLLATNLIVRGWITRFKTGYRTRIGHPAMLELTK